MSEADRTPDPNDPRRGRTPRPKRGRALLIGTFLGLTAFVFIFITLVGKSGRSDAPEVSGHEPQGTAVGAGDPVVSPLVAD